MLAGWIAAHSSILLLFCASEETIKTLLILVAVIMSLIIETKVSVCLISGV